MSSNQHSHSHSDRALTKQKKLTGERAAFGSKNHDYDEVTFVDGESPLKHASDISLRHSSFRWKYPLWYCQRVSLQDCTLFEMARAGIWYTQHIDVENTTIQAPKTFRRSEHISLKHVTLPNADETLWNCSDIDIEDVSAQGNYFAMNSHNIRAKNFTLDGNYSFDGSNDIEIDDARILSKDAFWNSHNVTVRNSFIAGEYLGWNSENLTFENCVIESLQGLCYIEHLTLRHCKLLDTSLAFEYSTVDAQVDSCIDSVLNPKAGVIQAQSIGELTLDPACIDPTATTIITDNNKE